jgi:beta-glucuronidase
VGDFQLLQEMGCNAIRVLTNQSLDLELLRKMYQRHGIMVILNDPFGAYTVNSGAAWEAGTDYRDPTQRKNMLDAFRKTVEMCKGEPWLLMYVLGNENNMPPSFKGVNSTRTNAGLYPEDYASLLQEAAELVHRLDPDHPVGVGNQGLNLLDVYAAKAPALDFIGINEYPGADGFGAMWEAAKAIFDRPVLVTEYGCDAYHAGKGVDEKLQAEYHRGNWEDIIYNTAGEPGEGNAIGGMAFEWVDEWWKDTSLKDQDGIQNTEPTIEMAFPDGWSHEEWLGIMSQGDGKRSPFLRQPRAVYYLYKEIWKTK